MTDYAKAEAELDAAHEAGEKRFAKLKAETLNDPAEMCDALSGIGQDQFEIAAGLIGKLTSASLGYHAMGQGEQFIVAKEIVDIAVELAELIEGEVEDYIAHY